MNIAFKLKTYVTVLNFSTEIFQDKLLMEVKKIKEGYRLVTEIEELDYFLRFSDKATGLVMHSNSQTAQLSHTIFERVIRDVRRELTQEISDKKQQLAEL